MITSKLKKLLLETYQESLTHIILNDSVTITDFEQSLTNDLLIVEFLVPQDLSEINKMSFYKDSDLLSERQLYVPITSDTLFKYKVEVGDSVGQQAMGQR